MLITGLVFISYLIFIKSQAPDLTCMVSGMIFGGQNLALNPQAPVEQKIADEVVFRRFQGEGVEFFVNRTSLTPTQIFDAHLLENFIAYNE